MWSGTKAMWCEAKAGSTCEAPNTVRCSLAFSFSEHVLKITLNLCRQYVVSPWARREAHATNCTTVVCASTAVVFMGSTTAACSRTWISHALSSLEPTVNLTQHGVIWEAQAGALALPYWPEGMSMSISFLLDDVGGPCLLQLVPPLGKCSWVI